MVGASFSRHGYRAAQFEDAFARFLPHGRRRHAIVAPRDLEYSGSSRRWIPDAPIRPANARAAYAPRENPQMYISSPGS